MNHQQYIEAVRDIAIANLSDEDRAALRPFKLTYGAGNLMLRGVTYYGLWKNGEPEPEELVEICALGEESLCQLAGTTIHEIGHVLAGHKAGHGKDWVDACGKLGLRRVHAAGTYYQPASFTPEVRHAIAALPTPTDGAPTLEKLGLGNVNVGFVGAPPPAGYKPRPCQSTHGCKGGKSRGTGSGSRHRKAVCPSCGYTIRLSKKWADHGMPTCPCGDKLELVA